MSIAPTYTVKEDDYLIVSNAIRSVAIDSMINWAQSYGALTDNGDIYNFTADIWEEMLGQKRGTEITFTAGQFKFNITKNDY